MVRKMLLSAAALASMFVVVLAAPASAQYFATINPDQVEPGGEVLFAGAGCGPNTNVDITVTYIESYVGADVPELLESISILADDEGSFSYRYPVPEDALPGVYEIVARCAPGETGSSSRASVEGTLDENGDLVFRARFIIPLPGSTPTTPGTPGDDIVRTGSDLNGLGVLGAGLLLGGGTVLFATRNRRYASS